MISPSCTNPPDSPFIPHSQVQGIFTIIGKRLLQQTKNIIRSIHTNLFLHRRRATTPNMLAAVGTIIGGQEKRREKKRPTGRSTIVEAIGKVT